ncbi:hypothetical protein [Photobacterium sp. GB-210]|uniref:hypothetical protein n=1 Tax=Photobacterium sp. GB-210 TaxID=2022104 RepID=UPI000D178431|nr:hypothetical protein [Photobacterium sp. GB-210]PSV32746.1 hypothetical protein C9J38_20875 [Photobacterium sp. GB-210]
MKYVLGVIVLLSNVVMAQTIYHYTIDYKLDNSDTTYQLSQKLNEPELLVFPQAKIKTVLSVFKKTNWPTGEYLHITLSTETVDKHSVLSKRYAIALCRSKKVAVSGKTLQITVLPPNGCDHH